MRLDKRTAALLDECLARIKAGETIESCLERYPAEREMLEKLLQTAGKAGELPPVQPRPDFTARLEQTLMAHHSEKFEHVKIKGSGTTGARSGFLPGLFTARTLRVALPVLLVIIVAIVTVPMLTSQPVKASSCVLSILSGSVEVDEAGTGNWKVARENMVLTQGAQVRTSENSRAILSFETKSTVTLEPDTEVGITTLEDPGTGVQVIKLKQVKGKTWSNVADAGDSDDSFELQTLLASALGSGARFVTVVADNSTWIDNLEGKVKVKTSDEEIEISSKKRVEVSKKDGTSVAVVIDAPLPVSVLTVMVSGPAVSSVVDPNGAATGILPDGLEFNQIAGSSIDITGNSQVIGINEPVSGSYRIIMRPIANGKVTCSVSGETEEGIVFQESRSITGAKEEAWVIFTGIVVDDGVILEGIITGMEILSGEMPENVDVVETENDNNKDKIKDKETPTDTPDDAMVTPTETTVTEATETEEQDEQIVEEDEEEEEVEEEKGEEEETQPPGETETSTATVLTINVNGPAFSSVIDPGGARTGQLPDGSTVNQIPGATIESTGFLLEVTIDEPVSGTYRITFSPFNNGNVTYMVNGVAGEEIIFEDSGLIEKGKDKDWVVYIDIVVEDGKIVSGSVIGVEEMPEN